MYQKHRKDNPVIVARYFKQFWNAPTENLQISSISFGVFSARDIAQLSCTQITSAAIYNSDTLLPNEGGPLDPRLGVSSGPHPCRSCNQTSKLCVGHFGHIDLVLPCFHIGYIKDVIQILRMICKSCSRVLLSPSSNIHSQTSPHYWRKRMSARILMRGQYQSLLKQLIEQCKKKRKCDYCGELNGAIKKHTKSFRILHEKYHKIIGSRMSIRGGGVDTNKMNENEETEYYLELYDNIIDYQQLHFPKKMHEFQRNVNTNTLQDLMPWDVAALFENILPADNILIGLRFAKHRPQDLILTKLPVPPAVLRPGAKLDADKANDDDLTVQLAHIVTANNLIRIAMEKGDNISTIIENFFYLNKKISEYFIADLPGYPVGPRTTGPGGRKLGGLAGTRSLGGNKGKKIRSFSDRLKGKFGRFRGNLSGKRVNFSGRTVISPDPNLDLDELGVPRDVCKLLTFAEMVTKFNIELMRKAILNGPDKYPGAVSYGLCIGVNRYKQISLQKVKFRLNIAFNKLKYGDMVERHLVYGDLVLFNRQPSLHRVSIMCHRVKPVPFRTFRFNPCCCNPYNADFDGDEMNIHAPQTLMARAEASSLMNVTKNFCAPKSADPLVVPLQDIITSTYLLTLKRVFLDKTAVQQLIGFMDNCCIKYKYVMPLPAILKPVRLWTGKQIFSMILKPNEDENEHWPVINLETAARNYGTDKYMDIKDGFVVLRNSELMCGNIDKNILGSTTKGLFFRMLRDYGSAQTARCMNRLTKLSTRFLQLYGFSIGIGDVTATQKLKNIQNGLINAGYDKCNDFLQSYKNGSLKAEPGCTLEVTLESKMNTTLSQIREDAGKQCIKNLSYYHNAPLIMAECGSKGSKINISQMVACVGQQTVGGSRVKNQFIHRTLPHFTIENNRRAKAKGFVENSFFTGITATEFFFHTMGGREGLVDTAVKTATTGYMQRRLMKNIEDVQIEYDFTVRNCKKQIVQFFFGHDGIDPMHCESKKNVVNFDAILTNIRAQRKKNKLYASYLRPQSMLDVAKKHIFCHISGEMDFVRRHITYVDESCELQFENQLYAYFHNKIYLSALQYGIFDDHWYYELYGYTELEIIALVERACAVYISCIMEPGSAVGGVSATSLGEPATQMTLKTFHFAGVASMNITQGVPRIREIINATVKIKTPVMTCQLEINDSAETAKIIKSRLDKTYLGEICKSIRHVIRPSKSFVECELDLVTIGKLYLEISNRQIADIIARNLKKVLPKIKGYRILASDIRVATKHKDLIRVQPLGAKISPQIFGIILSHLMNNLPRIMIKGLTKVDRALIHQKENKITRKNINGLRVRNRRLKDKGSKLLYGESERPCFVLGVDKIRNCIDIELIDTLETLRDLPICEFKQCQYQLYVEGKECFLSVLNIAGINAVQSVSNDINQIAKVLGIEAAMATIINELTEVYSSHGLKVDTRHLMLCADLMTYRGKVLGFSRHGMMGKEDKSILTMASYEETVKHLFQAALHGEESKICGVSDSIIVGKPIPIGTGCCKVLRNVDRISLYADTDTDNDDNNDILPKRQPLLLGECPLKAMTNNNYKKA